MLLAHLLGVSNGLLVQPYEHKVYGFFIQVYVHSNKSCHQTSLSLLQVIQLALVTYYSENTILLSISNFYDSIIVSVIYVLKQSLKMKNTFTNMALWVFHLDHAGPLKVFILNLILLLKLDLSDISCSCLCNYYFSYALHGVNPM